MHNRCQYLIEHFKPATMPSESKYDDDESEGKQSESKESEGCSKSELVEKVG